MNRTRKHQLIAGTALSEPAPGMIQVGSNPQHSVVFKDLTREEVCWLRSLVAKPSLGACSSGLTERQSEMLRLLDLAGLTQRSNPLTDLRVQVLGLDAIGVSVCTLLARAGVRRIEVRDPRPALGECLSLLPPEAAGLRRDVAVRSMLREIRPGICTAKIAVPDVAIVCAAGNVDHAVTGELFSSEVAHVVAVSDDRSASVGPVVLPGRGPCSLCAALHARDTSESAGAVLPATRRGPHPPVGVALASVAAGLAVGFVELLAKGFCPDRGASDVWRLDEWGVQRSSLGPHPECGCTGIGVVRAGAPTPVI